MDVQTLLAHHGGSCRWAELSPLVSRTCLNRALSEGSVRRIARGLYALPSVVEARATALRVAGTASHTTAALHWGWGVKHESPTPHITLPRGRKLRDTARAGVVRHWRTLTESEVLEGWVTSPERTVIDCCLDLPFDEALAVADSAWRAGHSPLEVRDLALTLPARSRRRVSRVLRHVDRGAANPFESVLRALCLRVEGLSVVTQHEVKDPDFFAQVDLADTDLRIVIEAEGFEHHGTREGLRRDCRRYTGLAARGWAVVRFTWDEVMFEPEYVVAALRATVEQRRATATTPVLAS